MKCARAWVLGPVLPAVAGCALAVADPPKVEVVSVELQSLGLLDQTFNVALCITNPNSSELAFRLVRLAVDLAGTPLANSESEAPVRLSPQSSTLVPFAVATTIRNLGPQLLGVVRTGNLEYRMHGTVQLAGPLGLSLPFSRNGQLGLISAGRDLLADTAAPAGNACRTNSEPVALKPPRG